MAIALRLFLIALPLEVEAGLVSDKPAVEKSGSESLTIQDLLSKARSKLREGLEGSTSLQSAATQAPDVKYLQQELDVVTAEAKASTSNLNVLRLLAQALAGRRHLWQLRYSIEHDEDIKTLDDAQVEIQQSLKLLD